MNSRTSWLLLAAVLFVCGCGHKTVVAIEDGGLSTSDAGVDGGMNSSIDAGVADAGILIADAGLPPELKIIEVLPPRGTSAGGTTVILQGQGFLTGVSDGVSDAKRKTTLKIGQNPVIDFLIIDDQTLELRTPPGNVGLNNLTMKNTNGLFVCSACYTYFNDLFATGLHPSEGPARGGNEVTIDGEGFTPDVEVLFGSISSPKIQFVSETQLKVIAPPGIANTQADVNVYNKNGTAFLRRVYRYFADAHIDGISPNTSPWAGNSTVTLSGTGFSGATSVKFGTTLGTSINVVSDQQLTVILPAASVPGSVDVTLTTPRDTTTLTNGFAYYNSSGVFSAFSVSPHVLRVGSTIPVLGQGLDAPSLTASIGGVSVGLSGQTFSEANLTVPARGSTPRRPDVALSVGSNTITLPQAAVWPIDVTSIAPAQGSSLGGTTITVSGHNFPSNPEVWFGGLQATVVSATDTELTLTTPGGSAGAPVDVRVSEITDLENTAVLPSAFSYSEVLAIGRVTPDKGAIAGATLVTIQGAGFAEGTVVKFNGVHAKDVKIVDSHTLTCRTPKADIGVVDVRVEKASEFDVLSGGYSYFDPRNTSGGLSGAPIAGTLNVTVLDSTYGSYGQPVSLANVLLGIDDTTPYQGLTDNRGQITFSDGPLVKAQTVTVFKGGYESATVTSVGAENLTVYIGRTSGGEGSGGNPGPGIVPSTISGRVTGFKSPRPLAAGEYLEARVFIAQNSLYSTAPFRQPPDKGFDKWRLLQDGDSFQMYTVAGIKAIYAILGIANSTDSTFIPYLSGVRVNVVTSPDRPATGQDIILDTHLDTTAAITIDSPLQIATPFGNFPAVNDVYAWLDLGSEGFIPNPNNWNTGMGYQSSVSSMDSTLQFPNFPPLDGSNFIFLNAAQGLGGSSYYFRRQAGLLSQGVTIGPMLPIPQLAIPSAPFDGVISWTVDPGGIPDIHHIQVIRSDTMSSTVVWSVVLPGTETQVTLPASVVAQLRTASVGSMLQISMQSSRSPKFNYNQWTYETLGGGSWSAFTFASSQPFTP